MRVCVLEPQICTSATLGGYRGQGRMIQKEARARSPKPGTGLFVEQADALFLYTVLRLQVVRIWCFCKGAV